jgi:hypothetical protein
MKAMLLIIQIIVIQLKIKKKKKIQKLIIQESVVLSSVNNFEDFF